MNNTYHPPFPRYDYSGLVQPTPVYVGDPSSSYVDILQRTVHRGIDHAGSAYVLPRGNFTMGEPGMRFHTGLCATQDVGGGRMSLNASSSSSSTTLSTAFSGHSRHPNQNISFSSTSYGPMQIGYPAPTVNNRLPTYGLSLPGNTIATSGHHYPPYLASTEPSIGPTQQVYGPEHYAQASYAQTMGLAAEYYSATERAYSSRIESNMYARTETVDYAGTYPSARFELQDRAIASCSVAASDDNHQALYEQGNAPDFEHQTRYAYATMSDGRARTDVGDIASTLEEKLQDRENNQIKPTLNAIATAREERESQSDSRQSGTARPSSKRSVKKAKTPRAKKEKSRAVVTRTVTDAPPKKRVTGSTKSEIEIDTYTLKVKRLYTPKQPYVKRKDNRQKPTMEVDPQIAVASTGGVEWEWKIDEDES